MVKEIEQSVFDLIQKQQHERWEKACLSCGACCGSIEGDPCLHLFKNDEGKYLCNIYENRLGIRKTRSGKTFRCVEIRDIISKSWPGDWRCVYKTEQI